MRAISAVDSVSPAIQRTREFLFRPFSWGTYLKLGLVAIITEGVGNNFRSSSHGGHPPGHGPIVHPPFHLTPEWVAAIVAAALVAIVLSFVIFYLITRLRFAFFHCLIHNSKEIRPGWWLYGGHPDIGLLLSLVLPLIPVILLLALAGILTDVILRDWMLPHYALDNATAGEAWTRVWARIQAEKRQFAVYALLRVVLPLIAGIGLFIVLMIPGLILAGSYAAFEYGLHSAFADATGAAWVAGVLIQAFFGLVAFGLLLLASICLGGPVGTEIREYALIFYGGRYQALGEILYPPPTA